ncbi:MAG: hypothetical protein GY782_06005 [Gammaproteobacteria bacterium]|nr:hypothetical protein [Gammaproteobacteria bacterium]
MKVAFFSTKPYEEPFFHQVNQTQHDLIFLPHALNRNTSQYVHDCQAVCVFVNDTLDAETLDSLYQQGVQLIALRCAGYNNVDLSQAEKLGLTVVHGRATSVLILAIRGQNRLANARLCLPQPSSSPHPLRHA